MKAEVHSEADMISRDVLVKHPILVVEDDEDMRENLRRLLTGAGYDVRLAPNGVEAMTTLESQPCRLVLTDLVMPGMGGLELLMQVRRRHGSLPVVFLTALSDRATFDRVTEMGAVDFLAKPFRAVTLLALVRRILLAGSEEARTRGG